MDELEVKIVLNFSVPENGLTLNGILQGLEKDNNSLMSHIVQTILRALEEKAIEECKSNHPGRYFRNGRQPRARKFITSFGPARYKMAQIYDKKHGKVFCPLMKKLSILPHKQYQRESMESAVGQAIHLSYRLASREVKRIKGVGPSKSAIHRCVQELAEENGQWPSFKHRRFKFLMVDGTKVRLQGPGAKSQGKADMRWALASESVGKPFEPVGFWVRKDWRTIRKDLEHRLDYQRLEILFSDAEAGIVDHLLSKGMRQQRCIWHGKRDFPIFLFQEGVSKEAQKPYRELMEKIPLFRLKEELLEKVLPPEKEIVVDLVETIKKNFIKLIDALDSAKYPKTRTYLINLYKNSLVFFDYWLERKGRIPLTTNAIESAFSRIVNRVKRIGRRWSEDGLINWLLIALRKIYQPVLWTKLWKDYLSLNKQIYLSTMKVAYAWI